MEQEDHGPIHALVEVETDLHTAPSIALGDEPWPLNLKKFLIELLKGKSGLGYSPGVWAVMQAVPPFGWTNPS